MTVTLKIQTKTSEFVKLTRHYYQSNLLALGPKRKETISTISRKYVIERVVEQNEYFTFSSYVIDAEGVVNSEAICGALRDLVPLIQFKKREKHPWRSINFSKVAV